MSNPIKVRPIKIMLDKERNLLFDLNAFEELEEIYGDLATAFKSFEEDKKQIKNVKNFLCAALKYEDETLTPAKIGTMIDYSNLTKIIGMIWDGIVNNIPDSEDGAEGVENPGE